MDWFKRYGIPGAYFLGLSTIWVYALYYYKLQNIDMATNATYIVGLAVLLFVPIGYVLCVMQQSIYLHFLPCGIIRRAMKYSCRFTAEERKHPEYELETESVLLVAGADKIEAQQFMQNWNRNRNDIAVISATLAVTTIFAPLVILLVVKFCFELSCKWNYKFGTFAIGLSIFMLIISVWSWYIVTKQNAKTIAGIYRGLPNKPKCARLTLP
ncbi:MAG TPA: hypothetical protein VMW23_04660 [Sedimentisphaerales bacterium]|nr:hypothetical protein [Sedimentisphaerales bacterium]